MNESLTPRETFGCFTVICYFTANIFPETHCKVICLVLGNFYAVQFKIGFVAATDYKTCSNTNFSGATKGGLVLFSSCTTTKNHLLYLITFERVSEVIKRSQPEEDY